jgi:methyl-accepting chemotaxis protein
VTIATKMRAVFVSVIGLTILNAVIIYSKVAVLRESQRNIASVRIPAILAIDDIRIADQRLVNALYGELFLRTDLAATDVNREQLTQSKERVQADLAKLEELSAKFHSQENQEQLAIIVECYSRLANASDAMEREIGATQAPSAHALDLLTKEAMPAANKIRDASKDMIAKVNEITNQETATLETTGSQVDWVLTTCAAIVALLGGAVSWKVTMGIVRPLQGVVTRAESIADGDLTGDELKIESRDEVWQLTTAVNKMQSDLAETIRSVAATSEHVATASEQISATASQTASSTETHKQRIQHIVTAMHSMSATVREVSDNSSRAAEVARTASETAREGGSVVDDTLARMGAVAEFVHETSKRVADLGGRSEQIGRIVNVIDGIADQTNLLALNAAIEAARAGEHGRGFAVVADEVRKLAESTSKATGEIAEMIQGIQTETRDAVTKMQSGTAQVETGVAATNRAGESLKQIIGQAQRAGEMISQIATAMTEQSANAEEVNNNMSQISQLVAESAQGARQSAVACEHLSNSAREMQRMVSRFHFGPRAWDLEGDAGQFGPSQSSAPPFAASAAAGAEK